MHEWISLSAPRNHLGLARRSACCGVHDCHRTRAAAGKSGPAALRMRAANWCCTAALPGAGLHALKMACRAHLCTAFLYRSRGSQSVCGCACIQARCIWVRCAGRRAGAHTAVALNLQILRAGKHSTHAFVASGPCMDFVDGTVLGWGSTSQENCQPWMNCQHKLSAVLRLTSSCPLQKPTPHCPLHHSMELAGCLPAPELPIQ